MTAKTGLTARQKRFAAEYLIDLNATQAAIRAGYSARSAPTQGPRLLSHDAVAQLIAETRSKVAEEAGWNAVERLQTLKRIADANEADNARVALAAIAEANKMQGSYVAGKLEVMGAGGGPIEVTAASPVERLQALLDDKANSPDDP